MSELNDDTVCAVIKATKVPVIIKGFLKDKVICQWSEEKWCTIFGNRQIPFRCMKKNTVCDEPCWERKCEVKSMTFKEFLEKTPTSGQWMYFDYKYLHQWFSSDSELYKNVSWKEFGFPEKDAADTTLWVGSEGAHTPAHQDTYGCNVIAQLHGKKRWILFPPEAGGMKPTRVPYEESSIYSELNFYCPTDLDMFQGVSGGRSVEVSAGDALVVPRGWWHYVQNTAPVNIALNIWLPHEEDDTMRVSEAIIRILVAQICKDLPQATAKLICNPNEDDLCDTPLAVLFLQLDTVAKAHLDNRRKQRRVKRQKTDDPKDDASSQLPEIDVNAVLENTKNDAQIVPLISSEDLINLIKGNLDKYTSKEKLDEDETDGGVSRGGLCLTKAVIDAFSEPNVIELVKENLFARLR